MSPQTSRAVFYEVAGTGAGMPLLTLHGGMGLAHSYLRPWLDDFCAHRPVIFYDHFGNGRSQPLTDGRCAATLESFVQDAETLRSRLGFERLAVYGHSFGGCIAIEYALTYPDRVAALILDSAVTSADLGEAMIASLQRVATPEQMAVFFKAFSGGIQSDTEYAEGWRQILPVYFCRYNQDHSSILKNVRFTARAFNQFAVEGFSQFRPNLGRLRPPTLVLAGAHDHIVPAGFGGPSLHAQVPQSTLHVFENSGHFPFVEEHAEYVLVVGRWLSGIDSRLRG